MENSISYNHFSSEDNNDEERVMHSKNDNIEIVVSDEADEDVKIDF